MLLELAQEAPPSGHKAWARISPATLEALAGQEAKQVKPDDDMRLYTDTRLRRRPAREDLTCVIPAETFEQTPTDANGEQRETNDLSLSRLDTNAFQRTPQGHPGKQTNNDQGFFGALSHRVVSLLLSLPVVLTPSSHRALASQS
jgi:hypothetical protein